MMNNLFSMFDPSTSTDWSLNWSSLLIPLMFFPEKMSILKPRWMIIKTKLMKIIIKDLKTNLKPIHFKNIILILNLFMMIFMLNFFSLTPFVFTPTSHLSVTLILSMPFWISLTLMGWIKTPNKMLIHLVPSSTPIILCPFMVMIETISNLIRPLTLTIRLTANMIAGHVLISLLSSALNMNLIYFMPMTIISMNILILLEMSMAILQSYVFITLLSLYLSEV